MRILILDGSQGAGGSSLGSYLDRLGEHLGSSRHEVTIMPLRALDIRPCVGCWDCWVRTPGACRVDDDTRGICREYVRSDLVIFASPVVMGFITALLKRANEKLLPLLHPHFAVVDGTVRHSARYAAYPRLGLLLEEGHDTDAEDISIIQGIYTQNARNLQSELCMTRLTSDSPEEVARAIDAL